MKLKHLSTAMILATLPATGVFAAALDRSGQSMSAFFQPGNYFEAGLSVLDPTVEGQEAGNMVDLDSDPTKLLDVVEIGKQQLITRGALTTFSLANDVSKYFVILPALFAVAIPQLGVLNILQLSSPSSAVISALIFNALIIPMLIPLALKGVQFKPASALQLLRRNMLIYGVGGVIFPFIVIKLIDLVVSLWI